MNRPRFAIHLSIFTKNWADDITPHIYTAKNIGYDGFEIPLLNPFTFQTDPIKQAIKETGMIPLCSTGIGLDTDISSLDETIRLNGLKFLKKCIDVSSEIGSHYLNGLTYSPWGFLQSKEAGSKNIETIKKSLLEIAEYAANKNVIINMEVVNRYETYVINTVSEAKQLIESINHPNLGIHYDTYHANIEEKSQYKAIKLGGTLIKHVHFASNYRGTPGEGSIDFNEIRTALEEIDYNHFISLENAVETDCEVGNGFNIWRPLDKDGTTSAKRGLNAMKQIMGLEE